jgi:hypothetical protein
VRVEEYLKIRVKDLGFNVDPVKGHDDEEDEDDPDEHWTSIQRMRQRCDDRLDEIEEAIRTIGRRLTSGLDIPEHKSDETRHEKRQKDKEIKIRLCLVSWKLNVSTCDPDAVTFLRPCEFAKQRR